ncbi:60S ribosomal protein L18a-like protein [Ricinus communis]|uniref:60S ribosomal protein L18a-like protein n=1 Tax=Ricinus communis TaxID=3988 RepID=UPI00201AAD13|nr:60S ribosomal protein L18a-like protein [Ricinus communis]
MNVEEQNNKGFAGVNNPSAPPPPLGTPPPPLPGAPPLPPMSIVNTNVYVNSEIPVTGYAVYETGPPRLPCCGIGVGWCLFILGWFLCGIPWYVGAIILVCSKIDPRERPGYIGCTIFE